jgi:microcystin-dependent protein
MKITLLVLSGFFSVCVAVAQNVGVDNPMPVEKLDVSGNVKANGLILNNGGSPYDFLMKNNVNGTVGFKKGHGAQAIRYIIAYSGMYPSTEGYNYDATIIGEIKLFSGTIIPGGWYACEGQILPIAPYTGLYSILQNNYGGNAQQGTFALPDLRGAAPVSAGTSPGGYTWNLGEKSN